MADFLENLVQSIRIDTEWLPPIQIDDPFAPGPPSPVLKFLRPKITIVARGGRPLVSAPWGEPRTNNWEALKWFLIAAGGVAAMGVASLVVHRYVRPRGPVRPRALARHG